MELRKELYGIIPPIVTPFDNLENLDEDSLKNEIRFMIDSGVHGLSLGGSTGEGALLTDDELSRGLEALQEVNKKRLPVICGIIRNSTREAVSAGISAKNAGADGLMVTPTFYHGTNDAGNVAFYKEIGKQVGLPIIIYNVIKSNPILPSIMENIIQIPEVIGIKQSVGGIHSLTDMIYSVGNKINVYGAQDDLLFCSYLLGAVGAISAVLTAFPKECVMQWEAIEKGDIEKALKIHYRILPVWRKIEGGAFPGKIKATLNLMGRNVGLARSPIMPINENEIKQLSEELKKSKFL